MTKIRLECGHDAPDENRYDEDRSWAWCDDCENSYPIDKS